MNNQEARKILEDNGFVVWKWGTEKEDIKFEGYLDSKNCQNLIGINEKCFVAILLNSNEARFIRNNKFEQKVVGHENQLQIERIIFGEDKNKLYLDGRLILLETIISADDLLDYLQGKKI